MLYGRYWQGSAATAGLQGGKSGFRSRIQLPGPAAFVMLKKKPDIELCRAFVAHCRNLDGGYGLAPAQRSNISATYFAAIILHWLNEMAQEKPAGKKPAG